MNCCDDYGKCTRGFNCPAGPAPTPVHILEFKPRQNDEGPTDAAVDADSPVVTYTQIARGIQVLTVITLIWALSLIWVAYSIVTGPTVAAAKQWIAAAANYVTSILPMAPFF